MQLRHCGNGTDAEMVKDGQLFRRVQRNCWDPDVRIHEMDAAGQSLLDCMSSAA